MYFIIFFVLTYFIFFVLFIIIGISIMLGAPIAIINFLQIVAACSSDFAIVILFNRIYPGLRLKDYIKAQFSPKLKFSILGTVVIINVIITVVDIGRANV